MYLNFCSLSSGSSGNCYYLGNENHGILIDSGISATAIRKYLAGIDIAMQSIMGVLVTHNHIDHIKGLEVLTRKNFLPAYTTEKIWKSILNPRVRISGDCIRKIVLQEKFMLAGFVIEAFRVNHDAPETVGYNISYRDKNITIVTDLGHICSTAAQYIKRSNILVIESNYDEKMLADGRYPNFLKARISSDKGHLGNKQTSDFLADLTGENIEYIFLAHLSKNNNTPEKALETLYRAYSDRGIETSGRVKISVLERHIPSEMVSLSVAD